MFCSDCQKIICHKCIFDNTHGGHKIVEFVQEFNEHKAKIAGWKKSLKGLSSTVNKQVNELRSHMQPSVSDLCEFRHSVLAALKTLIDKDIGRHKKAIERISAIHQEADKVSQCVKGVRQSLINLEELD